MTDPVWLESWGEYPSSSRKNKKMTMQSRVVAMNYTGTERIVVQEDRGDVQFVHLEESVQDAMGQQAWKRVERWMLQQNSAPTKLELERLLELLKYVPTYIIKPSGTTKTTKRDSKLSIDLGDDHELKLEPAVESGTKLRVIARDSQYGVPLTLDREDAKELRNFLSHWLGDES